MDLAKNEVELKKSYREHKALTRVVNDKYEWMTSNFISDASLIKCGFECFIKKLDEGVLICLRQI